MIDRGPRYIQLHKMNRRDRLPNAGRNCDKGVEDMPDHTRYNQFCPVAMAAEVLCARWTVPVLRELLCGSTRFNELRKGVPRMSPALLSRRLRDLEESGILRRQPTAKGGTEYILTRAGQDLREVVETMGFWGQRWVDAEVSLRNLDASLLMWDMRRRLDPKPLPKRRVVIQFLYPEQPAPRRNWWLVIEGGEVDLCSTDPGFDVDLYVAGGLQVMTKVWMGLTTIAAEERAGRLTMTGDAAVKRSASAWLGFSVFAPEPKNRGANIALRVA
jgi:DNA-binding HxlR family transcriptional regulator